MQFHHALTIFQFFVTIIDRHNLGLLTARRHARHFLGDQQHRLVQRLTFRSDVIVCILVFKECYYVIYIFLIYSYGNDSVYLTRL